MKTQLEWWMAIMAARQEGLSGWEEALIKAYWEEFGTVLVSVYKWKCAVYGEPCKI